MYGEAGPPRGGLQKSIPAANVEDPRAAADLVAEVDLLANVDPVADSGIASYHTEKTPGPSPKIRPRMKCCG